jgi:hypothetical protein
MNFGSQGSVTTVVECDRCGLPVSDPVVVDGKPLHQGPAHCDQMTEAAEMAAFLEATRDDHGAVVLVLGYADGRWNLDAVSEEREHTRMAQEPGESLGEFLLRVRGGLLPLP